MRNLFYIGIMLGFTQSVVAKEIKIVPAFKDKWNQSQLDHVEKAAKLVDQRMGKTEIYKCALRNSWRGIPDQTEWGRFMGVFRRQNQLVIHIDHETLGNNVNAVAPVGQGEIDKRNDQWKHLQITFNDKRVKSSKDAKKQSVEYWAATIAHELGHNMGLTHGSGSGSWESRYAGYFVTELGYCVMTDGKFGSDMGDLNLRRQREKWRKS